MMLTNLIISILPILIAVESSGNDRAIGDQGRAVGCLQVHMITVRDVNRITGGRFTARARYSRASSVAMATAYLTYYGRRYERITGKAVTAEVLARIWNGGPDGWRKAATLPYWRKAQREADRQGVKLVKRIRLH